MWALPRERRTIELVKEEVEGNATKLSERKEEVEGEERACIEGAGVWKSVIRKVEAVERKMKEEMERLSDSSTREHEHDSNGIPPGARDGMTGVLEVMNQTVGELEEEVATAEKKKWNLLVCAIGAELEALKQGRDMLVDALHGAGISLESEVEPELSMMTARERFSDSNLRASTEKRRTESAETNAAFGRAEPQALVDFASNGPENGLDCGPPDKMEPLDSQESGPHGNDDDDDEPGPDFLVEHV